MYKNEKWDVVDAKSSDSTWLKKVDDKALPPQMIGKSNEEKTRMVDSLARQRARISNIIGDLGKKRDEYINANQPKKQKERTLGEALITVIKKQAGLKGFVFKE